MLLTSRNGASALFMVSATALTAHAGAPACLSMIPDGADVIVVMPDLGELLDDVNSVNTMLGEMGSPELVFGTSMVRGMPGLDLGGSAAVILELDDENPENEPDAIALVPVSDFGALTQGRAAENGLVAMEMGGPPLYWRDLGSGYAAMSNNADMLRAFEAADHDEGAVSSMLGAAGMRGVESNDLFVMLNLDSVRPMMMEGMEALEAQGEMLELMMGPDAAKSFDTMMGMYRTAANDGHAVMGGVRFDGDVGFSMDMGLQFKEGSESAAMFNNEGNAGAYVSKIPQMDFLYAVAFDLTGDGVRAMLEGYGEIAKGMDGSGALEGFKVDEIMTMYDGGAMVVGSSDAMMMQGIFANSMFYGATDDPDGAIGFMRTMYNGLGDMEQPGLEMSGSMSEEPVEIAGVKAYEHSMRMKLDPSAMGNMGGGMGAPNPQMMMQMLYGPNMGPSGYVASVDGGVLLTMSKNDALLAKGVGAVRGQDSLGDSAPIAKASGLLPENRVMEMYVGVDHIMNMVGPMAMMFGAIPEFQPVGSLTPIAMGVTADGGGLMMRTVLPLETFKAIQEMVPADALNGGAGGWDEDWDEEDDDSMEF